MECAFFDENGVHVVTRMSALRGCGNQYGVTTLGVPTVDRLYSFDLEALRRHDKKVRYNVALCREDEDTVARAAAKVGRRRDAEGNFSEMDQVNDTRIAKLTCGSADSMGARESVCSQPCDSSCASIVELCTLVCI